MQLKMPSAKWWPFCLGCNVLVCDLNRTPIVMAKHGGPCVHFSGISTCGRTSRETVSHPQHAPLPILCKISLPVHVIVTNGRLQPLTTTWYNSLVLSFSLLNIERRLIRHRTFLRALHSWRELPSALQTGLLTVSRSCSRDIWRMSCAT